ncbi:hypothetical protein ACFL0Y_03720 [Patescibacteria group bacterium]
MPKQRFLTETDIDYLEKRLKEIFPTKDEFRKLKSDIFDKLDAILKEIQVGQEERVIQSRQMTRLKDQVSVLQKIHPQGKHAAL